MKLIGAGGERCTGERWERDAQERGKRERDAQEREGWKGGREGVTTGTLHSRLYNETRRLDIKKCVNAVCL